MGDMSGLHIVMVPAWWPSPERPGAGVFFADYAQAFAAAGARVGVVYPDLVGLRQIGRAAAAAMRPLVRHEDIGGVSVVRVRGVQTSFGLVGLQMRRFGRWLQRGLDEYRSQHGEPDILLAMCAIPAGWACTHLNDPLSNRVVVTEHTGPFELAIEPAARGPFVRRAIEKARAVVAVSETLRRQMQNAGIGREILVCGNPVADAFARSPIAPPRTNDVIRALFVGRLVEEKGIRDLCTAARSLKLGQRIEWHLVGDGPLSAEIARGFGEAGLSDRLVLHGHCERARVAELMNASDLLVLPTHGEVFGLAVAEALCVGLPVVTTRGTACADFVGEENGELVEVRNAASLAEGIGRLIGRLDRFDREVIARRARDRFSASAVAVWYAELFRRVIAK